MPVDITSCDKEPIHIPGSIQPHGVLIAFDENGKTSLVSQNAQDFFEKSADQLLDSSMSDFFQPESVELLQKLAQMEDERIEMQNPIPLEMLHRSNRDVDIIVHRSGGQIVAEIEVRSDELGFQTSFYRVRHANLRLAETRDIVDFTQALAEEVRDLTGFDRVMIYRFDPQWNGEVIAEAKAEDIEPFLGLRYPASDIPAQARALYQQNWLRSIPDATYTPVVLLGLQSGANSDVGAFDMSSSILRSVSPVHLKYLKNMGVASSMSGSLICGEKLWGLVACHHYSGAKHVPYGTRAAVEHLCQTSSLLIEVKETQQHASSAAMVQSLLLLFHARLTTESLSIDQLLANGQPTFSDVVGASGAAYCHNGTITTTGLVPSTQRLIELARLLRLQNQWPLQTNSIRQTLPAFADISDLASGVLGVEVDRESQTWLMWFRSEVVRTVDWAGNPNEKVEVTDSAGGVRLGPRVSFQKWQEQERGVASQWLPHEVAAANEIARHVASRLLRDVNKNWNSQRQLEASLISIAPLKMSGVTLEHRYEAAGSDMVGGDWFDAVALPSGGMALSLGDVAGHGIPAAATMAQLRHGLRAYLHSLQYPQQALEQLNELVRFLLPSELATGIVATLDADRKRLSVASAGHPPMLRRRNGVAEFLAPPRSPVLGGAQNAQYPELHIDVAPGDIFVFYSDGLVERRDRQLDDGLEQLKEAVANTPDDDLANFTDNLMQNVGHVGHGDNQFHRDDICLMVLRVDAVAS